MPAKPRWLLAIPDAISQLEQLDRPLLTCRDIERLFGVGKVCVAALMKTFGAKLVGQPEDAPAPAAAQEAPRPGRVPRRGGAPRAPVHRAPPGAVESLSSKLANLPDGVSGRARSDRGAVRRGEGRRGTALRDGACARERLRTVREARQRQGRGRRRRRGGEEVTDALVPVIETPIDATAGRGGDVGRGTGGLGGARVMEAGSAAEVSGEGLRLAGGRVRCARVYPADERRHEGLEGRLDGVNAALQPVEPAGELGDHPAIEQGSGGRERCAETKVNVSMASRAYHPDPPSSRPSGPLGRLRGGPTGRPSNRPDEPVAGPAVRPGEKLLKAGRGRRRGSWRAR